MVNKWELISKVNSSEYRKKVLESLSESVKTPSMLQKEKNIKISHISRALKELRDINLVKCYTPQVRKSKLYYITKLGKEVLKKIKTF